MTEENPKRFLSSLKCIVLGDRMWARPRRCLWSEPWLSQAEPTSPMKVWFFQMPTRSQPRGLSDAGTHSQLRASHCQGGHPSWDPITLLCTPQPPSQILSTEPFSTPGQASTVTRFLSLNNKHSSGQPTILRAAHSPPNKVQTPWADTQGLPFFTPHVGLPSCEPVEALWGPLEARCWMVKKVLNLLAYLLAIASRKPPLPPRALLFLWALPKQKVVPVMTFSPSAPTLTHAQCRGSKHAWWTTKRLHTTHHVKYMWTS